MSSVAILGGSVAGLSTALMLARAGHDVTVLERDPQPLPPDVDSAATWERPTVPQTQHTHSVLALGRLILTRRLPDVLDDLLAAGAACYPLADPALEPELATLAVRRTTLEWILRVRATLDEPRIRWRPGVVATGLLWRRAGSIAQVTGVRTRDHGRVHADLVVDATGRRSALPDWLLAAGVESAEVSQDCDLIAYSRFYRLRDGVAAPVMMRGNASILVLDGFGCYAFLADNRTIAVTVGRLPLDHELRRLPDPAAFDALVASVPALASLVHPSVSVPISGIAVMGGLRNAYRSPLADGRAQIHGLHAVGDALATTNPAFGRGVSLALAHAEAITDGLAAEPDRPDRQADLIARRLDAVTRPVVADTMRHDEARIHRWRTTLKATAGPRPQPLAVPMLTGVLAGMVDRDVFVRVQRAVQLLDPPGRTFNDSALAARIARLTLPELPHMGSRAEGLAAMAAATTVQTPEPVAAYA